jgi:hypothetical protein
MICLWLPTLFLLLTHTIATITPFEPHTLHYLLSATLTTHSVHSNATKSFSDTLLRRTVPKYRIAIAHLSRIPIFHIFFAFSIRLFFPLSRAFSCRGLVSCLALDAGVCQFVDFTTFLSHLVCEKQR